MNELRKIAFDSDADAAANSGGKKHNNAKDYKKLGFQVLSHLITKLH